MNAADLSITDIFLEKKEFSTKELPSEMPQSLKEEISKKLDGKKLTSLFLRKRVPKILMQDFLIVSMVK